jgi:hypothetical protein
MDLSLDQLAEDDRSLRVANLDDTAPAVAIGQVSLPWSIAPSLLFVSDLDGDSLSTAAARDQDGGRCGSVDGAASTGGDGNR